MRSAADPRRPGGRPGQGLDGDARPADRGRRAWPRIGERLEAPEGAEVARRRRPGGRARPDRHPRPPARAGAGVQGDGRARGTAAAAAGGFTAVACMANTDAGQRQPLGHRAHPAARRERAGFARVYPIGADQQGARRARSCAEIGEMVARRRGRGLGRRPAGDERRADAPRPRSTRSTSASRSSSTPRTSTSRATA